MPEEIPEVPRGALWTTLLAPPCIMTLITFLTMFLRIRGSEVLVFGIPILVLVSLPHFLSAVWVRYQGRSVVLMGFGFFIGECVAGVAACIATVFICEAIIH